ncbi:hypothetical protein Tco_0206834 [Tanacetum coccineum]
MVESGMTMKFTPQICCKQNFQRIVFDVMFTSQTTLHVGISSAGNFLGITPSYTLIRDLMLRLCHMWIAYNITERSQAPKKVTVTDLFYLRGMDVVLVNIPYLLARYLRMFALRRKRGAMITGGQFVAPLVEHFGLLTEERLQGLTVIVQDLPVIDMAELVRLQICEKLDDTWAWVAPRPERQQVAATGALEVAEGAFDINKGRLEDDVHGLRGVLGEQREDLAGKEIDKVVIMECLVKISKKARILEIKRRHLKITDSDILYAVSIKEDTAYLCLHFTKDHEGMKSNTPYPEEIHTPYSI